MLSLSFEIDAKLRFESVFELETDYDEVDFDNEVLEAPPLGGIYEVTAGTVMTFQSDGSDTRKGFKFCVGNNI